MSPGLRDVANALQWYGAATTDQLALALGVGRDTRAWLDVALEFWVRRGDATVHRPAAGANTCRSCRGCGESARRPPGPARRAGGTVVYAWIGGNHGAG